MTLFRHQLLLYRNIFGCSVEAVAARFLEEGDEAIPGGHNEAETVEAEGKLCHRTGRTTLKIRKVEFHKLIIRKVNYTRLT